MGTIPPVKIELIPEPKCDYPKASILLLKPWNSLIKRWYRTPNLSGGGPPLNMCLYLQSGEHVSLSIIQLNKPYK